MVSDRKYGIRFALKARSIPGETKGCDKRAYPRITLSDLLA